MPSQDFCYVSHGWGPSPRRSQHQGNGLRNQLLLPCESAGSVMHLWSLTRHSVLSVSAHKCSSPDAGLRSMEAVSSATSELRRINLSVFFASLGLASVYLIPAYAEGLGASYLELGFIGTIRSLPYMFLPVIVGYLGDRFDRRGLFLLSIFITGAATLMLSATNTVGGIVLVQVLLGIGFSLFWPLSEALVSETAPLDRRTSAMGAYGVAWASGFLIGPLVGGFMADAIGFQITFLVAGIIVVAVAGISIHGIRGSKKHPDLGTKASLKPEWALASRLLPMLMVQIPYGIVFAFIVTIFPGYAIQSGLTTFEVGVLVSGFGFTRIVMFSLSGRLERLGERTSTAVAFIGLAVVLLLIPINSSFAALLADMCALGSFIGIIYPQTIGYICKRSPSANMGFAVGLYETIFGIGFAAGPVASGLIVQMASPALASLVLAVVALAAIPMLALSKRSASST